MKKFNIIETMNKKLRSKYFSNKYEAIININKKGIEHIYIVNKKDHTAVCFTENGFKSIEKNGLRAAIKGVKMVNKFHKLLQDEQNQKNKDNDYKRCNRKLRFNRCILKTKFFLKKYFAY